MTTIELFNFFTFHKKYTFLINFLCKFRRIRVPTQYSFSRQILKVCNLDRVEARYLCVHLQIGQSQCTNCKSQILKFQFIYYSSQVITPDSAWYSSPSNSRIPIFFRVAKWGRVIGRNLAGSLVFGPFII